MDRYARGPYAILWRRGGRSGHDELGLLEFLDRLVAGRRHRRPQGAEKVEPTVVLVGGADEDLLERAELTDLDARATRQRRMHGMRAPVEPAPGRLGGGGQR